jgi:hypothetical protein
MPGGSRPSRHPFQTLQSAQFQSIQFFSIHSSVL